ncbi:hypothetical protein Ancab_006135 [Ancistrocladus abbreviatus]
MQRFVGLPVNVDFFLFRSLGTDRQRPERRREERERRESCFETMMLDNALCKKEGAASNRVRESESEGDKVVAVVAVNGNGTTTIHNWVLREAPPLNLSLVSLRRLINTRRGTMMLIT